jgi:hypothetical protein
METTATEEIEQEEIDLAPTEKILKNIPDDSRTHLIPTLQKIQNMYRYLPARYGVVDGASQCQSGRIVWSDFILSPASHY